MTVVCAILSGPISALCTGLIVATMIFELYGLLGLCGVKMSALPMVTILSGIGVSVEFVGHVANCFAVGPPKGESRAGKDRVRHCVNCVALPVFDGAISTLLGILMLAFSEFMFVRLYFFLPYVVMVLLGLFNGLMVLPVLLAASYDLWKYLEPWRRKVGLIKRNTIEPVAGDAPQQQQTNP